MSKAKAFCWLSSPAHLAPGSRGGGNTTPESESKLFAAGGFQTPIKCINYSVTDNAAAPTPVQSAKPQR